MNTTLLFGDTADTRGIKFLDAGIDDPEVQKNVGAVSFHSWRGWEYETMRAWYDASSKINKPLIVGEGSIDAQGWRYFQIFEEPHYALNEIKLYVRMLSICEPQSILQWQLTADYSVLRGGGIFRNDSIEMQPTRRFWNLKQFAITPDNSRFIPAKSSASDLYTAVYGNEKGETVIHIVNEVSDRTVSLSGIPDSIKELKVFATSESQNMEELEKVAVTNGNASLSVPAGTFLTLLSIQDE